MSLWYSPAGYGWYGSYGSWCGRRRGSWGGKSEVRSDVEWFCQKCGTGNWWSLTDCRHCASVVSDDVDIPQSSTQENCCFGEDAGWYGRRRAYLGWQESSGEGTPQTLAQEKILVLEKTLADIGDDEPIWAGKRVLEKELEKLCRKLNGPPENGKAHRGQTKIGSTENPNASSQRVQS